MANLTHSILICLVPFLDKGFWDLLDLLSFQICESKILLFSLEKNGDNNDQIDPGAVFFVVSCLPLIFFTSLDLTQVG